MTLYKLSPSDLTFAWDECKFCFYQKVKHNITLRTPFPGIFGKLANLTSEYTTESLPAPLARYCLRDDQVS